MPMPVQKGLNCHCCRVIKPPPAAADYGWGQREQRSSDSKTYSIYAMAWIPFLALMCPESVSYAKCYSNAAE